MAEQTLEEILGGTGPSPNEDTADSQQPLPLVDPAIGVAVADGSLDIGSKPLEVAGVVVDEFGNKWQVPGSNVEDLTDLYAGNIYKLPKALTDKFHCQLIPITRLREYVARKFVPVRLSEVGIPAELQQTTGQPLDGFHTVGDAILVKIPREIFDLISAQKIKEVKQRLAQLEPTEEMKKKAAASGISMRVERNQSVDYFKDPGKRPGLGLEDGGK